MANKARIVFLIFSYFLLLPGPSYSQPAENFVQGKELKDGDELASTNENFRLGFFKLSGKAYLGIWYNRNNEKPSSDANRRTPIADKSSVLTIDDCRNLKNSYSGDQSMVLCSVQGASNSSAILLDTGNFRLHQIMNSDGSTKWNMRQSFDNTTDTLLPGLKLGVNNRTGRSWPQTSSRSHDVPDIGSFTLNMDPSNTNQLIILWRGNIHSSTRPLYNGHSSSISYGLLNQKHLNFGFISNENETYFSYSVNKDFSTVPRFSIDYEGALLRFRYSTVYLEVLCNSFDPSVFFKSYVLKRPGTDGFKSNSSYNLKFYHCQAECLRNYSFGHFSIAYNNGSGEIQSTGTSFRTNPESGSQEICIHVSKADKWWIWLIVAVSGTVITQLCIFIIWKVYKAKGKKRMKQNILVQEFEGHAMPCADMQIFSFESITAATNNFSTENKLGEGGFGPVYKGKLVDGQEIAVKRLSRHSRQGLMEFKNEVILIGKLQHTNLVRLLGFCIEEEENVLIYEYMANKSLDFFLFDSTQKRLLNWKKRMGIIEGISQGLVYLHKYSRFKVIHRDLKASNVLLDVEMNPKISDFGLARLFGLKESEQRTNRLVGTRGYMPPEYAMQGIVSTKVDVFSFGVLLLEILSGKKNNSLYHSDHPLNLIGYAWKMWNEGRGLELIDTTLNESCPPCEALRCLHVGLLCVQAHATDRPTMQDVISMLLNEIIQLPAPKQPAYFLKISVEEPKVPKRKMDNFSINIVTISGLDPR